MPRKRLLRLSDYPYHVYNRSLDRVFYEVSMAEAWNVVADLLRILTWAYGFKIHGFVLMSNHYHLAVSVPELNLDKGMRYFQSQFSNWLNQRTGLQKSRFSGRYKWSSIQDPSQFKTVLRYIYQNPVRAKICSRAEKYPFSTLSGISGQAPLPIPITNHEWQSLFYDTENVEELLELCNSIIEASELDTTRSGLRRKIFQPSKRIPKVK